MRSVLDIPPSQRRTIGMEKVEESVEMNPAVGVGGIAVRLRDWGCKIMIVM